MSPHLPRRRSERPSRDGPNQPLLIATVADRFARGVDTAVESRVRHDPAAPNRSDKIVLANHAITVLDEIQQQVEHLRPSARRASEPPKLPTIRIEYLVFKAKLHGRPADGFHGMLKFIRKTIQVGVAACCCSRRKRPRRRTTPNQAINSRPLIVSTVSQDKASYRLEI